MAAEATSQAIDRSTQTGLLVGIVASVVAIVGGHLVFPASAPVSDAVPDRLTCYLPYLAMLGIPLMLGLLRRRIDLVQEHAVYLLLAIMIHFALLSVVPYDWLNVVPVMAIWFTIARLTATFAPFDNPGLHGFARTASLYPNIAGAIAVPILLLSRAFV
jgi:hypothetical protein